MDICSCGLIKQGRSGRFIEDDVEYCNNCAKPTQFAPAALDDAIAAAYAAPIESESSTRTRPPLGCVVVALVVVVPLLALIAMGLSTVVITEVRSTNRESISDPHAKEACAAARQ